MAATAPDRGSHAARALKYGTNVVIATVLFLVILGAINFFAEKARWRVDLTSMKQYTVSKATRDLLGRLQDVVKVTVYATQQNTPPDWTEQRNQLRDLLYEYRLISRGKINYSFRDPSADPEIEREAQQAGIQELLMTEQSATEVGVKKGYFGMQLEYKGKPETIEALSPGQSMEYELTRAINKVAEVRIPKVGVMAPGGNPLMGQRGNFTAINQFLGQESYTVTEVQAEKPNLKDIELLMIFEPGELSEEALYRIDQFVMNGGKLFVAAMGIEVDQRQGRAQPKPPNINSLLESYGLRVEPDLLEDWGGGVRRAVLTMRGPVETRDPLIIEVTDLNKQSPVTKDLQRWYAFFSSSVSRTEQGTSVSMEVLSQTSERTRKQESFFTLESQRLRPPAASEKTSAFNLLAQVTGTETAPLTSRYAVADLPLLTEEDGTTHTATASETKTKSAPGAQVVVCGSVLSFYDQVMARDAQANALLLLNLVDSMSRGGDMIALRSKQASSAVLKPNISPVAARTAQALAIGGIPVLLILFGIAKIYLNRMRRARYREYYGA